MGRPGYSAAHYRRLSNGAPDRPGDAERRVRERALCAQAHQETLTKYGSLNAGNVAEAMQWQADRIRELVG
jgi:hypothetical protein